MDCFHYQDKELYVENVPLPQVATTYGTPTYVYSTEAIKSNWLAFEKAFGTVPHRICYAVKANSNLAILKLLADLGSGFDIVSVGELERVLTAGGDPGKIVFSGVGKQIDEIKRAISVGIYCFNVECEAELERINGVAHLLNTVANVSLRVNPNIDPKTHHYISTGLNKNKFGLDYNSILPLAQKIKHLPNLNLISIGSHIGSQLTELDPFIETIDCLLPLLKQLRGLGFNIKNLNIGGGLGIRYHDETPPSISDYVAAIVEKTKSCNLEMIIEPGRIIVGNAGILLTRVEYLKNSPTIHFAIVDGAMNDLMRPSLYEAWHDILPVIINHDATEQVYDIVGPVCESSDFLGKDRKLEIQPGDLLAVTTAGAYGFSMSSNYNSRPRAAEVLINNDHMQLIRKREKIEDLFIHEQ